MIDFTPEHTPTFTLDRNLAEWKRETTPQIHALQADWDETGRLMDAARDRFLTHGNRRLYRIETRAIIEREDALNKEQRA